MKPPVAYEQWREQAVVVPAALHSDQRAWAVLRHDAVHEALEHPGISVNAQHPGYPKVRTGVTSRANDTMLPHLNVPMHGKFRRMMAGQFTLKRVNELRPELERIVTEVIDGILAAGGPVDFHKEVSLAIPTKVICALLGVNYAHRAHTQRLSASNTSASTSAEELAAAGDELYALLDAVITQPGKEPRGGLIGKLITGHMSRGEIVHRQILGMAFMIIVTRDETTATTISMGMPLPIERPAVLGGPYELNIDRNHRNHSAQAPGALLPGPEPRAPNFTWRSRNC